MTDKSTMHEDMMLGGEIIKVEVTTLPIDELELDPTNPRIQYRLSLEQDQGNLDDVILELSEVKELRKDIHGNGGLRERPYVQLNEQTKKYKVIEGNCRTVCIRDLKKQYTADKRWQYVPVRIFPPSLSGKQIAIFLSDQHVSGKISWKAHEQAGQIHRMQHELGMTTKEIALYLRIPKNKVERLTKAYQFMMRFAEIDGGKYAAQAEGKFTYFLNALAKRVHEALEKNDLLDNFCRWVGDNRFQKESEENQNAANVLKLDKILEHKESADAWHAGRSFDEAMKIVERLAPEESADQPIFKSLKQVQDDCGELQLSAIENFAADETRRQMFEQTIGELNRVVDLINRSNFKRAAE